MNTVRTIFLTAFFFPFFTFGQTITTIAGNGAGGYTGDGSKAMAAELYNPIDVAIDKFGNLYIVDFENKRIRKVNTAGFISTIAGTGIDGYNGDNIPATSADIYSPTGVTVDTFENIYFCAGDRIRKIDKAGIITTIAGSDTNTNTNDGIQATAAAIGPYGITVDPVGNIYFTDDGNHKVRKINTSGIITTIAGDGTLGYYGDNGPATAARFSLMGYIKISATGEIYVADHANNRVRKIKADGTIITFAGNGTSGNSGDGLQATVAQMKACNGIALDNSGNVYIIDDYNHNLRVVNSAGIISTIAGTGVLGYSGDNGPAKLAQLNNPNSVSCDASGNVYIADYNNNRVRKITFNTTGLQNINPTTQNISIYPSPAKDQVSIEITSPWLSPQEREVSIINLFGQTVYKQSIDKDKTTIDVSGYVPGLYIIQVNGVYVGRFMKE